MSVWPASVPQKFLFGTYRQSRPQTVRRSQPELGPDITRRWLSMNVTPFTGVMIVTIDQRQTLEAFFDETLVGGSLDFAFPAQDGNVGTWDCRFTDEPREEGLSGSRSRVVLSMVRLP